jgi:hypothetical protein
MGEFMAVTTSAVYRQKAIGESGHPCGNPILHLISIGLSHSKKRSFRDEKLLWKNEIRISGSLME